MPSSAVVQRTWDLLDDGAAAHVALRSEDVELLAWIAERSGGRASVRQALLENPAASLAVIERVLRDVGPGERAHRTLAKSRPQRELGELLARGLINAEHPREAVSWLGAHGALNTPPALDEAFASTEEHHWPLLLAELLRVDPTHATFDILQVVDVMQGLPGPTVSDSMWRAAATHLASRGERTVVQTRSATFPAAMLAELVNRGALKIQDTLAHLSPEQLRVVVRRLSPEHRLSLDELQAIAAAELTASEWHQLSYEPAAAAWAISEGPDVLAAGAGWQTENEALLVRLLRRNRTAHQFAGQHLRRVSKIWPRLSQRTRQEIGSTFGVDTLRSTVTGPIRDWLVACGPAGMLAAVQDTLTKTEVKKLVERTERTLDPEVAWVAAWTADRPRDRVRMVEIGFRHPDGVRRVGEWLRTASPTEIGRIWHLAEESTREALSRTLVALLRSSDETGWVEKVLPEISTDWQNAPEVLQDHAALWLSQNAEDPETWPAVWSLYQDWKGTLEDLLRAARHL